VLPRAAQRSHSGVAFGANAIRQHRTKTPPHQRRTFDLMAFSQAQSTAIKHSLNKKPGLGHPLQWVC